MYSRLIGTVLYSLQMTQGKVYNMYVISYACSVRSRIIISENVYLFKLSDRYLSNIGKKIVRYTLRVFAHFAALMRAYGVKVTQKSHGKLWICLLSILHYLLYHKLCRAVWIGGGKREVLCYRNSLWHSVNRSRRREHDIINIVFLHYLHKMKSSGYIIVIVAQRDSCGFTNSLKSGKMNNSIDFVFLKYFFRTLIIEKVYLIERKILSGYLLYRVKAFLT